MPQMSTCLSSVLIIDDDLFLRVVTETFFAGKGVRSVLTVDDGLSALKMLEDLDEAGEEPQLILCDIDMPNMDGLLFLRLLKEWGYQGYIVIMSGSHKSILPLAEQLAKLQELNIIGALAKPLKIKELENILRKALCPVHGVRPVTRINVTQDDLKNAIYEGDIVPYYQPKINAQTGRVSGVEALARWEHKEYGTISPNEFIGFAEETGLIKPLTHQMIRQVVRDTNRFLIRSDDFKIAINLSVQVLSDVQLPDQIAHLMKVAELDPVNYIFEITESAIIQQNAVPLEVMARLYMQGLTLSIDDFGTAYSNFEHLTQFPYAELKIDRMFVSKALHDIRAMSSVEASISLARKLDLKIVAEGVETREDWKYLRALGVDDLQGFYFSRPQPIDKILAFMDSWDEVAPACPERRYHCVELDMAG